MGNPEKAETVDAKRKGICTMRHYFNWKTAGLVLSAVMAFTALPSGTAFYADEYTVDTEMLFASEDSGEELLSDAGADMESRAEQTGEDAVEILPDEDSAIDGIIVQEDAFPAGMEDSEDESLSDAEDVFPAGLIEEAEPVAEDALEPYTETFEVEMEMADPFAPGNTGSLMDGEMLLFASSQRASASSSPFQTAYGQQLTGVSAMMYDGMVDHYINRRETGDWDWKLADTEDNSIYAIHVDNASSYSTSSEWITLKKTMAGDLQDALNAFGYDYPEFFWERIYKTTWRCELERDQDGEGGTVCIKSFGLKTKETYTGSRNDIEAFFTAVDDAVTELTASCDYTGDGTVSDAEYAKGAHDFAARKIWYDTDMLTTYNRNTDHAEAFRIFTPAPAFIESIGGGGVCEAYSRTVKVLLDRIGVTCCLLSGAGHMWNGIMIDGTWYLADATWDDNGSDTPGISYLFSGSDSRHPMSGYITGTGNETEFSLPDVSQSMYHEYSEWTVTEEASCMKTGSRERTCFLCGQGERETIPSTEHSFTEWTTEKQPSCAQAGKSTRRCTMCGRIESESIPALEHEYGEWTEKTPASCEKEGKTERACSICGKTETETVPATGHSFGEWKTVKDASCLEKGSRERTCTSCGKKESEEIPATGHTYSSKAVAPTCTADGYTLHTCADCGNTYKDSYVKATGHKFGKDSAKSSPATCTAEGEDVYVCSACGETKKEAVAKTGHSWSAWKTVSPATVFSKAGQERTCTACGKKETRETGSVLSAKISVNASSIKLKKGQKTTKISVSGLAKGDSVASWTSSDTKIVTCGNGWIKAGKKTGTAYVTVTTKAGASTRIKVKVQKAKVAVSKISVSSKKITLSKGQSFSLNTVLSPLTTEYPAKYKSSNKKTASVSKSGVIKARKKGKCTVTVKAGKKTVKIKVTVR